MTNGERTFAQKKVLKEARTIYSHFIIQESFLSRMSLIFSGLECDDTTSRILPATVSAFSTLGIAKGTPTNLEPNWPLIIGWCCWIDKGYLTILHLLLMYFIAF